jgi:LacI family transcriptional regulator
MSMRSERRAVTINDVARAAGVSRAAVSKVIRNAPGVSAEMRHRVGVAIDQLDYRPSVAARALRGSSYRLGLEIPLVGARFMTQIVDGAKSALVGTPYQLVLAPADGPEYDAILALADGLVDGIVAVSPLVAPAWLDQLARRLPVVMLGRHDDPRHYDTVVGDDAVGAQAAMDHLLQLGHRRIAHLTEPEPVTAPGSGTPHAVRLRVYHQRMADAGLGALATVVRRGPGADGARQATADLLAGAAPPTAIFAGHDDLALGALAAIADAGRSYGEVSVVGYDNTDLAAHPLISLTSVDQSGVEMGSQAVTMLLERMQGRTEPRHFRVTPSLQVRRSTGPPPARPL